MSSLGFRAYCVALRGLGLRTLGFRIWDFGLGV